MEPADSTTDIQRLHAQCVDGIDAALDKSFEGLSKSYNWGEVSRTIKSSATREAHYEDYLPGKSEEEIQAAVKERLRPLLKRLLDGWLLELESVPQDTQWPLRDYAMLKQQTRALLPKDGEAIIIPSKTNSGAWLEDPVYLAGIAVNLVNAARGPASVITVPAQAMAEPGIPSAPLDIPFGSAKHSSIAHLRLPAIARASLVPFLDETISAFADLTLSTTTLDPKGKISLRDHAPEIRGALELAFDTAMLPPPCTLEEFNRRLEVSTDNFRAALNRLTGITDGKISRLTLGARNTMHELYKIHCIDMREEAAIAANDLSAQPVTDRPKF